MPEFIKKKSPSKTKKIIISTSLLLLLITVLGIGGYIGYKYYLDYQQKKDLRAVIHKFKELKSSLSVGLTKQGYDDRLVDIKIEIDKFKDTHQNLSEQHAEIINLVEKAFQTYIDGEKAWGGEVEIALTNWKGDYFPWAENLLQKYPLLKNKIIRHNFYIDKSSEIHDAFHDMLNENEMERLINENFVTKIMNLNERIRVEEYQAMGATTVKQIEVAEMKNSNISTYIIQEISRIDYKDIIWLYASDYIKDAESLL